MVVHEKYKDLAKFLECIELTCKLIGVQKSAIIIDIFLFVNIVVELVNEHFLELLIDLCEILFQHSKKPLFSGRKVSGHRETSVPFFEASLPVYLIF